MKDKTTVALKHCIPCNILQTEAQVDRVLQRVQQL